MRWLIATYRSEELYVLASMTLITTVANLLSTAFRLWCEINREVLSKQMSEGLAISNFRNFVLAEVMSSYLPIPKSFIRMLFVLFCCVFSYVYMTIFFVSFCYHNILLI